MDILSLLNANIRRKKGTFISILLLILIVTAMTTAIFSVKDNYETAMEKALEESNCGDILAMISADKMTDELLEKIESSSLVESVEYYDSVLANAIEYEDRTIRNRILMRNMRGGIRLYNKNLGGFEENIPPLQNGEIYLPLGLKNILMCNVGDNVVIHLYSDETISFKVKEFVQEPSIGSMTIGLKQIFVSDEDRLALKEKCTSYETERSFPFTEIVSFMSMQTSKSFIIYFSCSYLIAQ